jgi:uncharacterized phage protein gp47/JayE
MLVSPVAYELAKAYTGLDAVIAKVYVDEDSGPWIDIRANEIGIKRKPGKKAVARVEFTGEDGTVIPQGKVLLTLESLEYTLDEETMIMDGTGIGALTASEVGEVYNGPAGAIFRQLVNISGITSIQSGAAEGGVDQESDAALVRRFYDYIQRPPTSGNEAHYEYWAKEVDGVAAAKCKGLWDGRGTVKVLVAGPRNQPVAASVVDEVYEHIETVRPIGPRVTVASYAAKIINVSAVVIIKTSTDIATVRDQFTQALASSFEAMALKDHLIVYNRIGHILLDIPGVVDFTGLTVNGGTANVAIGEDEVPVVGTVEVAQ